MQISYLVHNLLITQDKNKISIRIFTLKPWSTVVLSFNHILVTVIYCQILHRTGYGISGLIGNYCVDDNMIKTMMRIVCNGRAF